MLVSDTRESHAKATATRSTPASSRGFGPVRGSTWDATPAVSSTPTLTGRKARPAWTGS
ncbi:MAG TPA: hypothetical protein VI248_06185 [Kineosporiaceae bacterium]